MPERRLPQYEILQPHAPKEACMSAGKGHRGGRLIALIVIAAAAGGGYYWYHGGLAGSEPARAANPSARAGIPVTAVTASRQDMQIFLTGLGTAQAVLTVGIHSQVDGKLQQVLFTEGQHVNKGDVLAKIDPRLFQAALAQAKAKKAQDDAQLVAAQKDLARFK